MDLSIRRVLEGLQAGPATVGILSTRYGMEVRESHEALAASIDDGLVEAVGPVAFALTGEGRRALRDGQDAESVRVGLAERSALERHDRALRAQER